MNLLRQASESYRLTNRQTDRQTDRNDRIYTLRHLAGGQKCPR